MSKLTLTGFLFPLFLFFASPEPNDLRPKYNTKPESYRNTYRHTHFNPSTPSDAARTAESEALGSQYPNAERRQPQE